MRTADFDFDLPPELIAQHPAPRRDESRLLVLHRAERAASNTGRFRDLLEFFRAGDVLVLNNSRVIPARLRGTNARTGGQFEILLLEENAPQRLVGDAASRPNAPASAHKSFCTTPMATPPTSAPRFVETNDEGHRRLQFSGTPDISRELERLGEVPLPPYIHAAGASEMPEDRERYQTVFARTDGSVAAPTAGLHFTPELLEQIRDARRAGLLRHAARRPRHISAGEDRDAGRAQNARGTI